MADRIRMQTLALSTTALGQGVSFWHAGGDMLRSKSLDRNSYDSGDWFNVLDFSYRENGFGRGLPPRAGQREPSGPTCGRCWPTRRSSPAPADIRTARRQANALLEIRQSTPLFHLGTAGLVQQKVSFPGGGPDQTPGVIVMRIDDTVGRGRRPAAEGLVVVFNASPRGDDPDGGRDGRAAVRAASGPGRRRRRGGQEARRTTGGRVVHRAGPDGRGLRPALRASPESA